LVSGNYSVNIKNSASSYNSTSQSKNIIVNGLIPDISTSNPIICGSNISSTISTSYTGSGYSYVWYKENFNTGIGNILIGETGSSIIVTDVGRYYVLVNNGLCTFKSKIQIISYGPTATLTNSNNTNETILVNLNQTENLKVHFTGFGPWEVGISDGIKLKTYFSASSPLIIPVTPSSKTTYSIEFVSNICGVTPLRYSVYSPEWKVTVDVNPIGTLTLPTPLNLTVCKGDFIEIPYSFSGSLGNSIDVGIMLAEPVGNSQRNPYSYNYYTIDPISISGNLSLYIPVDIPLGNYSLLFLPKSYNFQFTNYAINVVNSGCNILPPPTISSKSTSCDLMTLSCSIYNSYNGSSNTFQWYKNGLPLVGKTSSSITVYESGDYTVRVINGSYNQISSIKSITLNRIIPVINSPNSILCGTNLSSNLNSGYMGNGFTYQWYKAVVFGDGTTEQIPIFGETSPSLVVSSIGKYSIRVWDGTCLQNSKTSSVNSNGNLVPTEDFAVTLCPPCPTDLNLISPIDDFTNGVFIKKANINTGIISANNKISGTANVLFQAGKTIVLNPGFIAEIGVVFKAEMGGCN
jgi:hypothetical protein